VAATIGLAATGTVYGVMAGGLRARETLVPLLILPAVAPLMLGATRAFEGALDNAPGDAWPWVQLLAAFAVLVVAAGLVAFGPLLEEA
jgi:heme exporter protein B